MSNKAHGGNNWITRNADSGNLNEEKNYGVWSETDTLRSIILRRPGKEIEGITNPDDVLWNNTLIPEIAREQHDAMAAIYKKYNIEVNYIETEDSVEIASFPNLYFVRDLFTMTPFGAIISRMASPTREGEETIIQRTLAKRGIPIIGTGFGEMLLEGPDILLVNRDLAFLGVGLRTNQMAVEYVRQILTLQGFSDIVILQTTYGCGHLDGVVGILNFKNAVIASKRFSYLGYEILKKHGFRIIELTDTNEVDLHMGINFVVLNSETILINQGAKKTIDIFEKNGIKCETVDVSELMNGGGSVHCMTGVLYRR